MKLQQGNNRKILLLMIGLLSLNPLSGQANPVFACNDEVNILLQVGCSAELGADQFLEGADNFDLSNYYVKVLYPENGFTINLVDSCGQFKYVVYKTIGARDWNPDGTNSGDADPDEEICWGTLHAEDKTAPQACVRKVVALWKNGAIYRPVTNEDYPCDIDGIVDGNDKILDNSFLGHGTTYLLTCLDVDKIYNESRSWQTPAYQYYTGSPDITDNCSPDSKIKYLSVTDQLIEFGCSYEIEPPFLDRQLTHKVVRTFVLEDAKGNRSSYDQEICFFRPKLYLPSCTGFLNACVFRTYNPTVFKNLGAKPYFINALGVAVNLTNHQCNYTVASEELYLPGDNGCGFKVIRTWKVLDWCWDPLLSRQFDLVGIAPGNEFDCPDITFSDWDHKTLEWKQTLVVDDQLAPVVNCPFGQEGRELVFSTDPFDCTTSFAVPEPNIAESCDNNWQVEVWTNAPVLWHGVHTGEYEAIRYHDAQVDVFKDSTTLEPDSAYVSNIPKGMHFLKYLATDDCGNYGASDLCPFFVVDNAEPVAVCQNDLTIGLSSAQINIGNSLGFARIFATEIDEGSWDACSEVHLQVRRFVPLDCLDFYESAVGVNLGADTVKLKKGSAALDGETGVWTDWNNYVDFICCDLNEKIVVELGVWDNANRSVDEHGNAIFGDVGIPYDGYPEKLGDHFNHCWLEVTVEDKTKPECQAPHDLMLSCQDVPNYVFLPEDGQLWSEMAESDQLMIRQWFEQLDATHGSFALAQDNCNVQIEMTDVLFKIICGAGYIERHFQAFDTQGERSDLCKQKIYLSRHHNYCIGFPKDITAECPSDPTIPGVELFEYACDLLAISTRDERFDASETQDACYKILRTYRVLNWCQFGEDADPGTPLFDRFETEFDIEPMVIGRDEDGDGVPGNEEVFVRFYGWENETDYHNELQRVYDDHGLTLELVSADEGIHGVTYVDDNCDPYDYEHYDPTEGFWRNAHYTRGFYQYTQVIKVLDQVPPIISTSETESFPTDQREGCTGSVTVQFSVSETCTADAVRLKKVYLLPAAASVHNPVLLYDLNQATTEATAFDFVVNTEGEEFTLDGRFPIGTHTFEVHVIDGCGNTDSEWISFEVFDDKAPAPTCLASVVVGLSPVDEDGDGKADNNAGEMVIWASDFIASDAEECSPEITYSIHRAEAVESGQDTILPSQSSIVVNCDDPEAMIVYIYAWDQAGNSTRCSSVLFVDDVRELCPAGSIAIAAIAGEITTPGGDRVMDVDVRLGGSSSQAFRTMEDGLYHFDDLSIGYDYTVVPFKNSDPLNGVSTYDLLMLSQHILGQVPLKTPFQMIAADVNNSGTITTLDLVQLRKLILSVDSGFASNTSWRFFAADYHWSDISDPFGSFLPEVININNLAGDERATNFIGVKIGDVSGDAVPNPTAIHPRSLAGVFSLVMKDQWLERGEEYLLPVFGRRMSQIRGFQLTLDYDDAVSVLQIQPGIAIRENFNELTPSNGPITISWHEHSNDELERLRRVDQPLFRLLVKPNRGLWLKDAIEVHSRPTVAEAYDQYGRELDISLEFVEQFSESSSDGRTYLYQNVPNPVKTRTKIIFAMGQSGEAELVFHDVRGRLLKRVKAHYERGMNEVSIGREELGQSGLVFYSLIVGEDRFTKKLVMFDN